ncbi:hypothetical protein LEMLEM_LOCUS5869 [Lemmus lemmus]
MAIFLLLLGLGPVLATPSGGMMKGITANLSQEELQPAAKQTVQQTTSSALSDKNISLDLSKNVMSASPPTSRRSYFVIPKGHTLSKDQNSLNGLRVWRMNESCLLGNIFFILGSTDMIHRVPKATNWKCGQTASQSLGLEHSRCKITAGLQCPRGQEYSVTSLKRILIVLTSHSLMSWFVSGSKL